MRVRAEREADRAAVHAVVAAAFGQPDEADLVDRLRNAGDSAVSLVAEEGAVIVGHVMLSVMAAPFRALALAPVSVVPEHHAKGVGSALVRAAIARAREGDWQGVFVLGDEAYYGRFGFDIAAAKGFDSPFAGDHFALLSFVSRAVLADGPVRHAPAFFAQMLPVTST